MKSIFTLFLLLLIACAMQAQKPIIGRWNPKDTTQVQVLTSKRGDRFKGRLLSINKTAAVFLLSTNDTIIWAKKEISRIETLNAKLLPPTFVRQRLFFAPTAFTLEKGISEYRNNSLVLNSYRKGLTDKFQMGVGFMPTVFINLVWTDFKYAIPLAKNLRVGLGGMVGGGVEFQVYGNSRVLGYATGLGMLTIGSKYNFINLAAAKAVVGYDAPDNDGRSDRWGVSMGGAFKTAKKNDRCFFELIVFTGSNAIHSNWAGAIGYTYERKRSIDFAIRLLPFGTRSRWPMLGVTSRRKK